MPDAVRPAVADAPPSFMDDGGKHHMVPLSALSFDAHGALSAHDWPLYATYKAALDPFLRRLVDAGALVPGPAPTAKPALALVAVTPGSSGVNLSLTFANVVPNKAHPPNSTTGLTVTETDTHTAIAVADLVATIGAAAGEGSRPGLVFVSGGAPAGMPVVGVNPLHIANPGDPAKVTIPKNGGGDAFTLQARSNDPDGALITVAIKDVDAGAQRFTMVASWTKTVNAQPVSGLAAQFAFVVTITPPDGGYKSPAAGTVTLSGGTDAVSTPATEASATVLSGV
jgi:hypothetical protein